MTVTVPTRDALLEEALSHLLALQPELSTSEDTLPGALVQAVTDLTRGLHINVLSAWKDIFLTSAMDSATLERHAEIRLGPSPRKTAIKATTTDGVRVTGTLAGAAVASGDTLVHTDGTRFELTESVTVGSGTADVSARAILGGIAGNKIVGETLDFESPPANIQQEASVVISFADGLDAETDGQLLARLLHAIRNPPAGGRFSDYWKWAMSINGVANAYVYGPHSGDTDGRRGLGIVDVAFVAVGTGAARIPSAALATEVDDYVETQRPATSKDYGTQTPAAQAENIDVQITPMEGYDFDWTGTMTVASWSAPTLTLTTTLPTSLTEKIDAAGSARIFVGGELLTATAYAEPAHTLTITETPVTTPAGTVYPGGPCSAGALAAIKAYVDTLGPARGTAADPNQVWDDTLRLSKLNAALVYLVDSAGETQGVIGIKDIVIVTPAANVTPVDNVPSGVPDLVVYGTVTVRP